MNTSHLLDQFKNHVDLPYRLYNSLFLTLPFDHIEKRGILLSLFLDQCLEGYRNHLSPNEIVDNFFSQQQISQEEEQIALLFHFIQFTERQVVLFDALEDAAFTKINDINGKGSLKHLTMLREEDSKKAMLQEKLNDFAVNIVLTAHPTQFYPPPVLGIIWDLVNVIQNRDTNEIYTLLKQLGKTPFLNQQQPTPYDEAISLIWFLKNVFYPAFGLISMTLKKEYPTFKKSPTSILKMGFWPGGDRDGNPYVDAQITLKVARTLRNEILTCYLDEVSRLKRRLTFKGVREKVVYLEAVLRNNISALKAYNKPTHGELTHSELTHSKLTQTSLLEMLSDIKELLAREHNNIFTDLVEEMMSKVELFGLYFASLDIRQDSSIHKALINHLIENAHLPKELSKKSVTEKIKWYEEHAAHYSLPELENPLFNDVRKSMQAMQTIQQENGENGAYRYIISHTTSALDVMRVYSLLLMSGWQKEILTVDIVPLIESIQDLQNARTILETLYQNSTYRHHLNNRNHTQTVMLGFSDGSKDGGYLMGNWSIFRAKEMITEVSEQYGVKVIFFDGRGGAAARGGGKTHNFFASQGKTIANHEIQLTVQGQTISSNFGTIEAAQYNLEQLLHAGLSQTIDEKERAFSAEDETLLQTLAEDSYSAYSALKNRPEFMDYLLEISPLRYYNETNIASRPTKRGGGKMTMADLRAIPYVASWSQIKQNITGFYGVGTALKKARKQGHNEALKKLYKTSLFFRTLIDNSEMALKKSFLPLTTFLKADDHYAQFWQLIYEEYHTTKKELAYLTETKVLMTHYPVERHSIEIRETMVLPLATIQQYAMKKIRIEAAKKDSQSSNEIYEKLVMRCSFGLINAGRNSA